MLIIFYLLWKKLVCEKTEQVIKNAFYINMYKPEEDYKPYLTSEREKGRGFFRKKYNIIVTNQYNEKLTFFYSCLKVWRLSSSTS